MSGPHRSPGELRAIAADWQTLAQHATRGGRCVRCEVRRCWPRANAIGNLVAAGEFGLFSLVPPIKPPVPPAAGDPTMCMTCAVSVETAVRPHPWCETEIRYQGRRLICRCPVCHP
ncbi:hypothetical protein ACFFWC_24645 [Plantactinospora siamensis]|uniref:Uncharacterized protein n=1 Tax=Plantactinospora siamensis TaxID=555372 RepID=A0ABV6P6H2_9ACTN